MQLPAFSEARASCYFYSLCHSLLLGVLGQFWHLPSPLFAYVLAQLCYLDLQCTKTKLCVKDAPLNTGRRGKEIAWRYMEYFQYWVVLLGKGLSFFRCIFFSEQILSSSFCSSNFCVLSVVSTVSTPFLIHSYMCLPVPFPTSPGRATSHFSPPLLLCLDLLNFSYRDPGVLFLGQRGSILSTLVAVSWRWDGFISAESSRAFINSLQARSSLVWLSQCG